MWWVTALTVLQMLLNVSLLERLRVPNCFMIYCHQGALAGFSLPACYRLFFLLVWNGDSKTRLGYFWPANHGTSSEKVSHKCFSV